MKATLFKANLFAKKFSIAHSFPEIPSGTDKRISARIISGMVGNAILHIDVIKATGADHIPSIIL